MQKKRKRICNIVLALLAVGVFLLFLARSKPNGSKLGFLDVGQGDAIYIETQEHFQVLIDGGPDDSVLNQLRNVMPIADKSIDLVILSHGDADHLTGLVEVLQEYEVSQVVMPDYPKESRLFESWNTLIAEQKIPVILIRRESFLTVNDSLSFHFLHPTQQTTLPGMSPNNASIIMMAELEGIKILFTGDIESEVETQLTEVYPNLKADLLKAPHHGSKSSSSSGFLDAVSPAIVIIQVGRGNKFSHPHTRSIYRYGARGMQIFRTDEMGTITFLLENGQVDRTSPLLPGFPQILGFRRESVYTKGD